MNRIALFIMGTLALIIIAMVAIRPLAEPKKIISPKEIPQKAVSATRPGSNLAPEFSLKDAGGGEKKLSDFKGSVVIIDFWATWCPPCRQEIPHFVDLYSQYKDQGLEIIGVSMDQSPEKVIPDFIEKNNINYTILFGEDNVYDLYGGINAIPTTFLVDKEGNIRKKYIGYNGKEVFEKDIKELL
ncbi:MAG: TlpA disulfide reductase family protein [Candidatus Omnitrophota bacterium]|nr:TlpA disulfide reductase family protein [Candidatus Omnitrophota bacterium]